MEEKKLKMETKREIGDIGEEKAVEYLVKKGYQILAKNWYCGHREVDIIAYSPEKTKTGKPSTIVFVEVKTRSYNYVEDPVKSVTRKKQQLVVEAANAYISRNDIDMDARFDIIIVTTKGEQFDIEHIEEAFYPMVNK